MPGYAPRLFTGGQLDSDYNCTVIVQTNGVLALWPIIFYLISVFKNLYLSLLRITFAVKISLYSLTLNT